MFKTIKNLNWIILSSFLCIILGILTFLTFINQGFIKLTDNNLKILLITDIILLIIFFSLIIKNLFGLYIAGKKNKTGSQTSFKYISLFTLFTFIPSLLIAVFSLIIFNFGIQNFFNDQIKKAVSNSYDVAKNYLEESKKNVGADVILMSVGINRASQLFYSNQNQFKNVVRAEKLLRRVDDIYLIDSLGNIIFSDLRNPVEEFIIPTEVNFNTALEGRVALITNNLNNKTSFMIKLNNLIDTYLYISKNIEPEILSYLNETEEAVSFYYSVQDSQTGIKITFVIIYIIVVTLLLFFSIVIAIAFATRLTKPIVNLISASQNISLGMLNTKVPEIEADQELQLLNKNFNNMIDRLKKQQDKLLITERYSAWESVARKLAHEIKNPLTPIQLSIDRLREKYSSKLEGENKLNFSEYLETINRQIKDIENLVNEFSSFARMPSPVMKKTDLCLIVNRAINFINMSSKNNFIFNQRNENFFINGDEEQLYRVMINLIKNSQESFDEKKSKKPHFIGKIDIDIKENNDYIFMKLIDNGTGIVDTKKVMTPYFTTKKEGTGLGLPIVSKIINEHSGEFTVSNNKNEGVEIQIIFPKLNEK